MEAKKFISAVILLRKLVHLGKRIFLPLETGLSWGWGEREERCQYGFAQYSFTPVHKKGLNLYSASQTGLAKMMKASEKMVFVPLPIPPQRGGDNSQLTEV